MHTSELADVGFWMLCDSPENRGVWTWASDMELPRTFHRHKRALPQDGRVYQVMALHLRVYTAPKQMYVMVRLSKHNPQYLRIYSQVIARTSVAYVRIRLRQEVQWRIPCHPK